MLSSVVAEMLALENNTDRLENVRERHRWLHTVEANTLTKDRIRKH